jgi:hypothetical protein
MAFPCAIVDNEANAGGGGGGAPVNAQYVVMAADGTLTQERVLTAGTGISIVDGGAGGPVTISATPGVGGWTDDGTIVRLTTATDRVAIGTAVIVGTEKLRVVGTSRFEGGTPAGTDAGIFSSLTGKIPLGATWRGVHLDYNGVDAGANDGELIGLDIDMSGTVSGAPAMQGIRVVMPAGFSNAEQAMHLEGDGLAIDFITSGFAMLIVGNTITTGTIAGGSGTAALPEYTFAIDTDTGMLRSAANTLGLSTGGVQRVTISTASNTYTLVSLGPAGSAAAPTWSFSGDSNTGAFSAGADVYGISTGGTSRFTVSTTTVSSTLPIFVPLGSAAAPTYSITGDTNTGLFSPGADLMAVSTGGTERVRVSSAGLQLVAGGSAAAPAISLTGDTNTGIAWTAADTLVLSTDGTARLTISSTGQASFSGDVTVAGKLTVTGAIDPPSVRLSGGTALFYESANGNTAGVSAANEGRIRYNSTTQTWQMSANGAAYVDIGTGLSGGGTANEIAFWSGATSLTSDAGLTYSAADDRLTTGILSVGTVNATPATGDIWRNANAILFHSTGGTRTVGDLESVQTVTGQKTFEDVIFTTNAPTLSGVPLAFSTPITPAAGGQLGRSLGTLQWHDGSAVRGVLTDGQVQTVTGQKTFEDVIFTTNAPTLSGVPLAFSTPITPVAAGQLGRSSGALQWHDGAAVRFVVLDGQNQTITGQKTFTALGWTTTPVVADAPIAFHSTLSVPTSAGELGRSGANLFFNDGTENRKVMLAGSASNGVKSAIFTLTGTTTTPQSTGAIGFTPRAAILIARLRVSDPGNPPDGFYTCQAVITGTGAGAKAVLMGIGGTGTPANKTASDADAAAGAATALDATSFDRDLDVTAFSSAGIEFTWSINVSTFTGYLLVIGD